MFIFNSHVVSDQAGNVNIMDHKGLYLLTTSIHRIFVVFVVALIGLRFENQVGAPIDLG